MACSYQIHRCRHRYPGVRVDQAMEVGGGSSAKDATPRPREEDARAESSPLLPPSRAGKQRMLDIAVPRRRKTSMRMREHAMQNRALRLSMSVVDPVWTNKKLCLKR